MSAIKKWESISRRLRFIQDEIWTITRDENKEDGSEINSKFLELKQLLKNHFGPRIATEVYWKMEKR